MCIYITSDNGLCNRLSILCAHSVYQGRGCKLGREDCRVYVRWNVNDHCNGRFEEIFEGIDNVSFVKNYSEIGFEVPRYIASDNVINVFRNYYGVEMDYEGECRVYGILKFRGEIQNIVKDFIEVNFGRKTVGLHIRRTDDVEAAKRWGNYTSDEDFDRIIESELSENGDTKFYLSTDNEETQRRYRERYNDSIVYYRGIESSDNLRQTSLRDAGIDLCLLSYCHHVEGSFHSTFTRLAIMLNLNFRGEYGMAGEELRRYFFRKL